MERSILPHPNEARFTRRRWLRGCGVGLLGLSLTDYLGLRRPMRRGGESSERLRPRQGVHRSLLLGRRQPTRYLGSQAGGAGGGSRRVQAHRHHRPRRPRRRAFAAPGSTDEASGGRSLGASHLHGARQIDVLEPHRPCPAAARNRGQPAAVDQRLADAGSAGGEASPRSARLAGRRADSLSLVDNTTLQAGDTPGWLGNAYAPSCCIPTAASPMPASHAIRATCSCACRKT